MKFAVICPKKKKGMYMYDKPKDVLGNFTPVSLFVSIQIVPSKSAGKLFVKLNDKSLNINAAGKYS